MPYEQPMADLSYLTSGGPLDGKTVSARTRRAAEDQAARAQRRLERLRIVAAEVKMARNRSI